MRRLVLLSCLVCLVSTSRALAQEEPLPPPPPAPAQQPAEAPQQPPPSGQPLIDMLNAKQNRFEVLAGNHWRLTGAVEIPLSNGATIFADEVDVFLDDNRVVASGNVVFGSAEGRIAAERMEYNTSDGTGTYYQASGLMSLGDMADRAQFGNQDPDVYFWGETIEKVGNRRYQITRGGFTTCVQPTPRWEVTTGTMALNLDDYAVARNTVLRVKGVPLLYLPLIYYPIQKDERATGFLLPTYGTSTLRGQAISNAFFWAIDRSQDATFFHDWFTRAGQGAGAEYRYIAGQQSQGNFRLYRFHQQQAEFTQNGTVSVLPANTSYEISGVATQAIAPGVRARARIDYFSDIVTQQLYQQNVYQASRRNRIIEGVLTAGLGRMSTSMFYQRNELFNSERSTQVYGSTPRITAAIAPEQLFGAPLYASLNSEYAFLPYRSMFDGQVVTDSSLSRIDVAPTLRVPLSRLTYLSVNTSAAYRTTFYSRSADPADSSGQRIVDEPFLRHYMAVRSDIVGPVFTRIWDLPESGFAERLKHVIEPAFSVDFTSRIEDYTRTPILSDTTDFVVGGATRFTYGLTNRFFYRGRTENGTRGQTREFITAGIQQTYYSNPQASRFDSTYQSSFYQQQLHLSPIALTARVSPSTAFDANARIEYDVSGGGMQALSTGGTFNAATASASLSYSRRHINKQSNADDYLTASTTHRWLQGRASGTYTLSWDIGRNYIVSQTVNASYLAQCCGLQVEFQQFNYPNAVGIPIPADRRFNFGFVLAGLGTFSNFFGAFGGQR